VDLGSAIDGLYGAFAGYSRPVSFEGCSCCWDGRPILPGGSTVAVPAPGGRRPLHELDAEELSDVAASVPLTAGTLEVLKHYLPRILEIAVGPGFDWPDIEIVFGRLNYETTWTSWPSAEAVAIRSFLHAFWEDRLCADPAAAEGVPIDAALCAVGCADPDIGWYLDAWLVIDSPHATDHLEQFLSENAHQLARGRLANAFWTTDQGPARANQRTIVRWAKGW
jgi:hypothetical protein